MAAVTRRHFLQSAARGLVPLVWPRWMPRLAFAPPQTAPRGDVLVCVFLRGAADGLNMVVPHGEDTYYRLRPTLAIPRPDDHAAPAAQRTRNLDGFFGLHPALAPLMPAWEAQHLAVVHACGSADESRSHFQAMELMERGVDGATSPASGWIGRHLAALDTGNTSPLRAIGLGDRVPRALQGSIPAAALRSITDFHLGGDPQQAAQMQAALAALYTSADPLGATGAGTLDVLHTLVALDPARYAAAPGVQYPASDFGQGLRQVALLIKAGVGLEVACLDLGGWDTHFVQGGSEGTLAALLADLGAGLAAFYADLHQYHDHLLIVTLSEFGRRVQENGSLGTDHGHGGLMLLLGGGIRGGHVHGRWPGLAADQLVGPGDLAVTTDYRAVLSELVQQRLNNPHLADVFPGYTPQFPGVLLPTR